MHGPATLVLAIGAGLGLLAATATRQDICLIDPAAPIPDFCDTDSDGYGNQCDADFNDDGIVGVPDFPIFSGSFGGPPRPSGLACAGTATCP